MRFDWYCLLHYIIRINESNFGLLFEMFFAGLLAAGDFGGRRYELDLNSLVEVILEFLGLRRNLMELETDGGLERTPHLCTH